MKKSVVLFCCVLLASACSVHVDSKYDRTINFAKYKSFCWLSGCEFKLSAPPEFNTDSIREGLQRAVKDEMLSRGIRYDSNQPDLLMDIHISIETDTAILFHRPTDQPVIVPLEFADQEKMIIHRGTWVTDIVDRESGHMIWRSVMVSYFEENPALTSENFHKGAHLALKDFPPTP